MDVLLAIAIGLVAGGLIGWLAGLFMANVNGMDETPRWPAAAGAALGLLLAIPVLNYVNPPTADEFLLEVEEDETYLRVMREQYPDEYEELRDAAQVHLESRDADRLLGDIRTVVTPLIEEKLLVADNALLRDFATLLRDQAYYLAENSPQICSPWLAGTNVNSSRFFDLNLIKQEYDFYEALLEGPSLDNPVTYEQEELVELYTLALARIENRMGISEIELTNALDQMGPGRMQCLASAELMQEILAAPEEEGAQFLRTLMVVGRGT